MNSTMIGFMKKALTLACLALALTGTGRVASACSVWYQDAYDDGTWVYSNMTAIQQMYGDSIRAYEWLGSPDSRNTSQDTGDQIVNEVVAWADLPINYIDGAYTAEGEAYENDVQEGSQQQQHNVPAFIQIVRTAWTPAAFTQRASGSDTYQVEVRTSSSCATTATIEAGMTRSDQNMLVYWTVNQTQNTSSQHGFSGGQDFTFNFPAATDQNNTIGGTVTGSASWVTNSAGCTQQIPDAGSGNSLSANTAVP
jgi:hypothetical protein